MNKEEKSKFFNNLAIGIGHGCNPKSANDMYYAFIKLVIHKLKKEGKVRLPDFGDFKAFSRKPHQAFNIKKKELFMMPPHNIIKFKPHYKFKKYINIDIVNSEDN